MTTPEASAPAFVACPFKVSAVWIIVSIDDRIPTQHSIITNKIAEPFAIRIIIGIVSRKKINVA
jgi:hypothetical protein